MSNSVWREKHKSLEEFYRKEYPQKYFDFSRFELDIDPDETVEDFEQYDAKRQQQEFIKCHRSFSYFCHKFVKIGHPIRGLLPFILFKYQKRVINEYEGHRFNIISKFRQGGLTTVTVLWGLWRGMFKNNETIMLLSKTDREAIVAGETAKLAMDNFPSWFRPNMGKNNDHEKHFEDSGSKLLFFTPEAARGRAITYLILDEAAFIKDMDRHWAAIFPTIATGGKCIAVSTVNGIGNWYEEIYHGSQEKKNNFNIIDIDFEEHPDYDKPGWAEEMKAQLGPKRFRQEIMRDFLGSGATYIPADMVREMGDKAKKITPARMIFPEWVNSDREVMPDEEFEKGALWIFREPIDGRDYIIGVDASEGMGDEGDNNCFQVIDKGTMEQVAEFYSNVIPVERFSKILNQIGIYYNNALMVVESMGAGFAIINKLQNELFYENLYYENVKNIEKAGIKVGSHNRTVILEAMQHRIMNKTVKLNSIRLINELKTFTYNPQKKKVEALKGKHDDAIFAIAHAIAVRDQEVRSVAVGSECPKELSQVFKSDIFNKIKEEILAGAPEDWLDPQDRMKLPDTDEDAENFQEFYARHRPNNGILIEFGWIVYLPIWWIVNSFII